MTKSAQSNLQIATKNLWIILTLFLDPDQRRSTRKSRMSAKHASRKLHILNNLQRMTLNELIG